MRNILIADNQSYQRRVLKQALERCGHRIGQAANCAAVLEYVLEQQPDVLVIDMHLDGLDIQALCERLKNELGDHAPFICLNSDRITAQDQMWWRELAGTVFFERPLSARTLSSRIASHFADSAALVEEY